jgi:putative proteasome-type protease
MLAASGNLSVTQGVVNLIGDGIEHPESGVVESVMNTPNMLHAAQLVGRAVRLSRSQMGNAEGEPAAQGVSFDAPLPAVRSPAVRSVFLIYTAGNSIECAGRNYRRSASTNGPILIGRSPMTPTLPMLKIGLFRWIHHASNLSVGMPIDIAAAPRALQTGSRPGSVRTVRIFAIARAVEALREAHMAIPSLHSSRTRDDCCAGDAAAIARPRLSAQAGWSLSRSGPSTASGPMRRRHGRSPDLRRKDRPRSIR